MLKDSQIKDFSIIKLLQRRYLIAFLLFVFSPFFSQAQKLTLIVQSQEFNKLLPRKSLSFKDSIEVNKYLNKKLIQLQRKGYLLASIDSVHHQNDSMIAFWHIGTKFQSAHLSIHPDEVQFLRKKARLTEKHLNNLPFTPQEIVNAKKTIHQALENNGYPFASVELSELTIHGDEVSAIVDIRRGQRMKWAKINLIGDEKLSQKLICSYIQIKEGDWFNQENLNLISNRISLLPFVEEVKPAEILFTPWGAELYLYLKSKKVSSADGIIGLQPKNNGKGYALTGELRLKLVNQLKIAENFELQWKSIQKQTQSLDVNINLPNLFNSRFGFNGDFNLYKHDSTFLDIHFKVGVQYSLNNGSYLHFYYRNENSSILRSGLNNMDFTNLNNSKTNAYGISYVKQTVNYLPNPSKGYSLIADVSIGLRKTKHPDSTDFAKSTTFKFALNYQHFVTLHKRNVLRLGLVGNYLLAPYYFENEVFRFGGQFLQRGFNEEQLKATALSTATVEYRFLVDQNSFAFAFYEQSFYQNKANNQYVDFPLGFGLGFSFGTKIGSFSISYALGKQKNTDISFKDGKIHFGYIAYF